MTDEEPTERYAEQQQVIDDILASHAGRPVPVVRDALRAEFRAHGLTCPPLTWLSAVAAEINLGHVYVTSASITHSALEQERP
jgi:hypothetical protein